MFAAFLHPAPYKLACKGEDAKSKGERTAPRSLFFLGCISPGGGKAAGAPAKAIPPCQATKKTGSPGREGRAQRRQSLLVRLEEDCSPGGSRAAKATLLVSFEEDW
jgi:hypothetical protein